MMLYTFSLCNVAARFPDYILRGSVDAHIDAANVLSNHTKNQKNKTSENE